MLFTSLDFFLLLAITFAIYYLLVHRTAQVILLIISSFVFYAWNYPLLLLLLVTSITINILSSYWIEKSERINVRRLLAIIGVVANLGILAFFKYSPLIGATFFKADSAIGEFLVAIPLPIGISFFTFQGISLVVDTFRKEQLQQSANGDTTNFFQFAINRSLFIAFFPQLIAGPIVKAHEFLPQVGVKYFKNINWETCFKNLVTGYFLKTVVADNLMDQTAWMDYPHFESSSGIHLLSMLFGYSIQIFADFAGYSLIAIGVAGLFGYYLKENFNFPYISTSFSEFWRRWHISLSSFLKEYLYIPLGGNRKGKVRTYLHLMITMVLGGFWHGAAWSYAIWGTYHGVLLALERLFRDVFKRDNTPNQFLLIGKGLLIFGLVTAGWLLFRLPEFGHVIGYVQSLRTNQLLPHSAEIMKVLYIFIFAFPVLIYHLLFLFKEKLTVKFYKIITPIIYAGMLFLIATNRGEAGAFIYFQF